MKKRIISIVTVLCLVFFVNVFSVYGENQDADNKTENTKEEVKEENIKKLEAKSPYAIVIDMKNGNVLYSKKANVRVYPASLTKIMTAVIAIEKGNLEDVVTASETALANVEHGDSILGIKKDEKLSVRQLLYAVLLSSAADASNVLAEHIGGSIENFVKMMNSKAKEIGMKNTNFINPVGDHDERHYTTAEDMAKLALYAMNIKDFSEIVKCDSYVIRATEKTDNERKIVNGNHFVSRLKRTDYYYQYATGIKTGYTKEARSCIAASAEKNGMSVIALVFAAKTVDGKAMSFIDCRNMFDFIFENYVTKNVVASGKIVAQTSIVNSRRTKVIKLETEKNISALTVKQTGKKIKEPKITFRDNIPKSVEAPIKKGQKIGTREYFMDGCSVGKTELLADSDYEFDVVSYMVNSMIAFVKSPWLYAAIIAVIFLYIMAERRRRRILRKKRRDARKMRNRELMRQMENMRR